MNTLRSTFIRLGDALHPLWIMALIVGLNVYWVVTLDAYGQQFQQAAGYLPIDLQNVSQILTPAEALAQIATYSQETKALYWSFFIMDNTMPMVAFSSFALLWVFFLRQNVNRLFERLLHSPFILIPLGVGFFDWIENLCFAYAMSGYDGGTTLLAMQVGLVLVRLKAVCLFATFGITAILAIYHLVAAARRRIVLRPAAS